MLRVTQAIKQAALIADDEPKRGANDLWGYASY